MHQYCLLNCACYIINTHTDMTWIWYDKGIRGEELEKERSECIFHELQSSPAKVLDMMFQFQRRKRGTEGQDRQICGFMKTNLGFHMQLRSYTSLFTHPEVDFDRPPSLPLGYRIGGPVQMWYNIPTSFNVHWCLNIWWAVALLQLLILNKSEGWISLRVAFSISPFLLRLVRL